VLRGHLSVLDTGGERIGQTTSGTFSPTLGQGIGLALIDAPAGVSENDEIAVDVRGRRMRVRVVKPPFLPSHVR
jgi:aminomethyltransferase